MPMDTSAISNFDSRYCIYCVDDKTRSLKSKEDVREGSILAVVESMGKSRQDAEKFVDEMMAKLPRWKGGSPG